MKNWRRFFRTLHLKDECKELGVPMWQCPHFLFLVMGILIIISILAAYAVGSQVIADPFMINMMIFALTGFLMILAFFITRSFEGLAEANRLKTEFVSIVSHQLRAPLTNFKWTLDLFDSSEGENITKEQAGYLQILIANAERMQGLVNELLTVSRIQQGRLPLYVKQFSFPELIQSITDEFGPFVKASNIDFVVEGDDQVQMIETDPDRLRNVLANLVDNAIKYTKKSIEDHTQEQGKIVLRYKKQGSKLYCEVEDNGIGIPAADQKYIFERFFRSKNVLKHETHGSGLGLYIAKSIIEKTGGKMEFRSEENKGSTFWFTIPFKNAVNA